ncbi:MAG: hypothetical protein JWQ33_1559 [Ramlibacter sp.]|nr:hypothetical protein [Ramlibacter sp.]
MRRAIRLLVLLAGVALGGCASVSGGNVQKMYVQAQAPNGAAVTGADCVLSNDKGTWRVTAPGDTSVVRSNKRMEVKCDRSPLPQGVVSVESATRSAMYGNIILGGVVGAVIDHNSGAAYEYPEMIKVVMGRMVSMDVPRQPTSATRDPNIPRDTRVASARPAASPPPAQAAAPVPVPVAAVAPVVSGSVVWNKPASLSAIPAARTHSRAVPPASGYAAIDNVEAVPARVEGKTRYGQYLAMPSPKAFVVYETGGWRLSSNTPDAMVGLLDTCAREGRKCWLYAVDDQVVWKQDVQQRIGRSDQLNPKP